MKKLKRWTREEDSTLKKFVDSEIEFSEVLKQIDNRSKGEIEARIAYLAILFSGKDLQRY